MMLVFLSDIHFSDTTPDRPFNARAFRIFGNQLKAIAGKAEAREVELVLLGDSFDLLKSPLWQEDGALRPWSSPDEVDFAGRTLEACTVAIVKRITANKENREARGHLLQLRRHFAGQGVPFRITCLMGNHDRLLNRYPDARREVARFLFQESDPHPFPGERLWPEYRVFARHGECHDRLNASRRSGETPLGDAVVLDLLERFRERAAALFADPRDPRVSSMLEQIENVRPTLQIPAWLAGLSGELDRPAARRLKRVWNETVDHFLGLKFVRKRCRPFLGIFNPVAFFLRLTRLLSFRQLARLPLARFFSGPDEYAGYALREAALRDGSADFVVYGHTHHACITPLLAAREGASDKILFNTGTWRTIHERTRFDRSRFAAHQELTFVAFYREGERVGTASGRQHRYEVWRGALG